MSEGPVPKGPTSTLRVYRGDMPLIARLVRLEAAERDENLTAADIIHDLLRPYREAEQRQERGQ